MRTAILLASSAAATTMLPPDQLFRQDNFKGKCYDACKGNDNQAGLCEDFCGEGGYCCSGENYHRGNGPEKNGDCPAGAVGAIYTIVHTCAIPMSVKDAPKPWATYVQDNSKAGFRLMTVFAENFVRHFFSAFRILKLFFDISIFSLNLEMIF